MSMVYRFLKNMFLDLRVSRFAFLCAGIAVNFVFAPVLGYAQAPQLPGFDYSRDDFFNFVDPSPAEQAASSQAPALPPPAPSSSPSSGLGLPFAAPGVVNQTQGTLNAIKEETRRQAFDAALEGMMPLRPEEIRTLLERYDRTQESVELPIYPAPKPQIAVETLSLDPGARPKTISVSHGYVTTFTVVDSTGAPWPIEDMTWAGDFDVIESGEEASHFVRITPRSEHAFGNMSMRLVGLQTPLILSMRTARDLVHYRFDAIVPKVGPFAEVPLIESGITVAAGDANMSTVLEGGLPMDAERLDVSGTDGRTSAYGFGGVTYLRTPLTLLSPAWTKSTSSSDGMRVYAFNESPVVLLSDQGRMVRVRLSARGDY